MNVRNWSRRGLLLAPLGFALPGTALVAAQAEGESDAEATPLQTAAALAVAYAFQAQTNLGLLADAFAHKVYDKTICEQVLKTGNGFLEPLLTRLEDLEELNLDEADKQFFNDLVETLRLIKNESDALTQFVKTGGTADRSAYLDLRDQVKTRLDTLLKDRR